MGEARRRLKLMEEGKIEKPEVIVITCPVCKAEYRSDSRERLLVTSYAIPAGKNPITQQMHVMESLPKVACTSCGVEFFAGDALKQLRDKAKGERSNIVIPKIVGGRMN